MKVAVVLLIRGLPAALGAQTQSPQTGWRVFSSPDGVFRELVRCAFQPTGADGSGNWAPSDDCSSQGFLCGTDDSTTTLACVAFPANRLREKPEFGAAAFFVAEVADATSPEICRKGCSGWDIHRSEDRRMNRTLFRVFHTNDAWMSHAEVGEIYRAFHNGTCYELGIQQVSVSAGAFDEPIPRFTKEDQAEVDGRLREALKSFRFLRHGRRQ